MLEDFTNWFPIISLSLASLKAYYHFVDDRLGATFTSSQSPWTVDTSVVKRFDDHGLMLLQVSLHLNLLKDEVARAWPSSSPKSSVTSPFVGDDVLEAIESVLRPHDRAPELPAQIDPVSLFFQSHTFKWVISPFGNSGERMFASF